MRRRYERELSAAIASDPALRSARAATAIKHFLLGQTKNGKASNLLQFSLRQ